MLHPTEPPGVPRPTSAARIVAFARSLLLRAGVSERILLQEFQRIGLRPQFQAPFGPYVADFLFPEIGLCVEVDGPHHEKLEQRARDKQRDTYFYDHGFVTIRISSWVAWKDSEAQVDRLFPLHHQTRGAVADWVDSWLAAKLEKARDHARELVDRDAKPGKDGRP
jgi:very-short-patch-repair endonuclease